MAAKMPATSQDLLRMIATGGSDQAEDSGGDYGEEIDIVLSKMLTENLTVLGKVADFDGNGGFADRTKFWLQTEQHISLARFRQHCPGVEPGLRRCPIPRRAVRNGSREPGSGGVRAQG